MAKTIHILNGPNLNLLGKRQPEIYGAETLADVEANCARLGAELGLTTALFQAAYTHTSVAILDALNTFEGPVIEVHISNVHKREAFRHHSYVSLRADGVIAGLGIQGYELALRRMATLLA